MLAAERQRIEGPRGSGDKADVDNHLQHVAVEPAYQVSFSQH